MNKELVLEKLVEQKFVLEEADNLGYSFEYEGLSVLYMPVDGDDCFLRLALPRIYDVTDENRPYVIEVVNDTNMTVKYTKTCVIGDDVWIFYEYRVFDEDDLDDILRHCMHFLEATIFTFYKKIEGDDCQSSEDDNDNNNESKEDVA